MYLSEEGLYQRRLEREGKAVTQYAKFSKESSLVQQEAYLKMADEIMEKYPNINVIKLDNSRDFEVVKEDLRKIINY